MIWNISGYDVLVDTEDYDRLKGYNYFVNKPIAKKHDRFYFIRNFYVDGRRTITSLHRDIMGCVMGDDRIVDHISGNTLDNRRCNLRLCTNTENCRNSRINRSNTSGVKGVYWHKASNKWMARINYNGSIIYLGTFADINDAATAYAEASKKYHGEFGRIK